MAIVLSSLLGVVFAAALPYWLPRAIVGLRMWIFTRINGDEGIAIPGPAIDVTSFTRVYADPAADGRSRGAALSDLFWYWLSPGAELHQEHLEPGPVYEEVAHCTRRILALPRRSVEELAARCTAAVLDAPGTRGSGSRFVRLRELVMPVWAAFYYELVFGHACPARAQALIVGNANDVVTALKCCGLRHMRRRARLTQFLVEELRARALPHVLPACFSLGQQALYLQGVFFNTAVVQMSEALTHVLMTIAQHPEVQNRLAASPADHDYLDRVISEVLRLHPLFGISHRITSAPITLAGGTTIAAGSVLCFNHAQFQQHGFERPEQFDPDRWERLAPREANFIPFGVVGNRPCPAQSVALITLRVAARELLARFALRSSAAHTRSIPNRGPCLLVPRGRPLPRRRERALLFAMRLRDRWEDLGRSILQLVLGSFMVWDARRLRLCERHFAAEPPAPGVSAGACPAGGRSRGQAC